MSTSVFSASMCGEKTLERQGFVNANQSYCLTDYGHYLKIFIPYKNSNVTITTSGGTFSGADGASIELYSNESWNTEKIVAQVNRSNTNDESLSFLSSVGNHYFTIGGNVTELTLLVTVSGGDIPAPLGDFIVFDTEIAVTIPNSGLTSKAEFSTVVDQLLTATNDEYQVIAENNPRAILTVAQAIHFIAEQNDITDTDLLKLIPFIESYERYGDEVNEEEALAVNNALLAVANMNDFITVGESASTIQQLYFDALYIFERTTKDSYYPNHLPHVLSVAQLYSLQVAPYSLPGAISSMTKIMSSLQYALSNGNNGVVNAYKDQMLDVLSVIRSFALLGETSLDRRWTTNYDLTWFTYYTYFLLAEIYQIANEDVQNRIDGIFKEIHQTLIPEVEQKYLEKLITDNFIKTAGRECTADDSLAGYCWVSPSPDNTLTVTYDCSPNITIRAQSSITNEVLVESCEKMAEIETKFHTLFSTQGMPLLNDNNHHLEVVAFASPDDYEQYAEDFFDIDTDNGGIYLEGSPSNTDNQARFIAMQCPEDWVGFSCEKKDDIYNLTHEFVHYLDGRYIKAEAFGHYNYVVAWSEGLAEYLANGEVHSRTLSEVEGLAIPPLYNALFMDYNYGELYQWAYFAIRFLAEEYPDDFQLLASTLKTGDKDYFTATLRAVSDRHENNFEQYVLAQSAAVAPAEAEIPLDNQLGSCALEQQYARKYDALSADSLTITNTTDVPISLFWISNTLGKVQSQNYKTLGLGESYFTDAWLQTDRMMLTDSNRNCIAVAVINSSTNEFTVEATDVEHVVNEVLPEADQLGSCELMQPHIPSTTPHEFTITNTTDYPVHIFRVNDITGEPIYSTLYDTLAIGESYTADYWYGNRRVMIADRRLNCLAVGVLDQISANYFIDEAIVENGALAEELPENNTIGSCELIEKHLIDEVAYNFSITNTTDTSINLYRIDNNSGEVISETIYDTLAKGETFTADYWYGLRRVAITDENDQCLGVAILNQKDDINEFTFTEDYLAVDSDGDGSIDSEDAFPNNPDETSDSDSDGVGDNSDAFPDDNSETSDSDGDGVGDNSDAFPDDNSETSDSDGDGVGDNSDAFPDDSSEISDSDGDGVGDNSDAFPEDNSETSDSDGDGTGDNNDAFPDDPNKQIANSSTKKKGGSSGIHFIILLILSLLRFKFFKARV